VVPSSELRAQLVTINDRLQNRGIALRLEHRGTKLAIRGPLPPKTGRGAFRSQRLSLGLAADEAGLELAQRSLQQVHHQLVQGRFQWAGWIRRHRPSDDNASSPIKAGVHRHSGSGSDPAASLHPNLIADFQAAFHSEPRRRCNPAGTRSTWATAYRPYLRRLAQLIPGGHVLDSPAMERVLESYPQASRSRAQCATALAALAGFAGIDLPQDWQSRAGGYGLHRARFRQLPGDAQIERTIASIPNPGWRLIYGLMATYGLRNHEVFFADLAPLAAGRDRVVRVLPTSKTGEHQVWPFPPFWVERFDLQRLGTDPDILPPVCCDLRRTTLQQVGRRVSEQFRRYQLPHTPYDLRHAWAVRTILIGLPDTVAARMMGHSVAVHTRTYHHWITRRDQQQAVDAALARRR